MPNSTPASRFLQPRLRLLSLVGITLLISGTIDIASLDAGERIKVNVTSTIDGSQQPSYVILPDGFDADGPPVPLLVSLHSWSTDVELRRKDVEALAEQKGWIYLFPNFRGPNEHPDACGSLLAQQDILDAVAWTRAKYPIDPKRIYLTGGSGGGHMTLLMVGRHPELWAAASAWVGISNLAAWHARHTDSRYGQMLRASCGGAPGDSPEVDRQYRERSPLTYLAGAKNVPVDIAAGVHDGHQGSVPIRHSLDAFNVLARATESPAISDEEIRQLSQPDGQLKNPQASDQVVDSTFGRKIYLRRHAGESRVTIFEGGHESIATAAIAWLEKHQRNDLQP